MTASASPQEILESLVVKMICDADQFLQRMGDVQASISKVEETFDKFAAHATIISTAVGNITTSLGQLVSAFGSGSAAVSVGKSVETMIRAMAALGQGAVAAGIIQLGDSIKGLMSMSLDGAASQLKTLGDAIIGSGLGKAAVGNAAANIQSLGKAMESLYVGVNIPTLARSAEEAGKAIGSLSTAFSAPSLHLVAVKKSADNISALADAFGKLAIVDASSVTTVGTAISKTVKLLSDAFEKTTLGHKSTNTALANIGELGPKLNALAGTDVSNLATVGSGVKETLENIGVGFKAGALHTDSALKSIKRMSSLGMALTEFGTTDLTNLGAVRGALADLFGTRGAPDSLAKILQNAQLHTEKQGAGPAITFFSRLARAVGTLGEAGLATRAATNLADISAALQGFTLPSFAPQTVGALTGLDSLRKTLRGLATVDIAAVTGVFNALPNLIGQLAGLSSVGISGVLPDLLKFRDWIRSFSPAAFKKITDLTTSLGPLTNALTKLSGVSAMPNLTGLATSFDALMKVSPARLLAISRSMGSFAVAAKNLSSLNTMTLGTSGTALINWFNQFNALAPQTISTVSRLGRAMNAFYNFTSMGGKGPLPPVTVTNSLNTIPPAANAASSAIGRTSNRLSNLNTNSLLAGSGLGILRYGLMGVAAFGVTAFARMDDSLARVLARMRLFPGTEGYDIAKLTLSQGIKDISGGTVTSRADLLKGATTLNPDMNAAMAVEALTHAESFAVAGAIDMNEAAQRLTDTLSVLGSNTKKATLYLEDMKHISDLLVGTSLEVGGTTKDLSEAFSGKFLSALKATGLEAERGIALLGAYSRMGVGKDFRGSAAGDMAARFLLEMDKSKSQLASNWQTVGIAIKDAAGNLLPFEEQLNNLQKRLATETPAGATALLRRLGFEGFRDMRSILPLIQSGGMMKELLDKQAGMAGITNRLSEALRGDFLGQIRVLWNNLQNVATVIGERLAPALFVLIDGLTRAFQWFTHLNPAIQNLAIGSVALYYGLMPVAKTLIYIGSIAIAPFMAIGSMIGSIGKMLWSFAGTVGRVFWSTAVAIHGAINSMFVSLWTAVKATGAFLAAHWSTITDTISLVASTAFSFLKTAFVDFVPFVLNIATTAFSFLKTAFADFAPFMLNTVTTAFSFLKTAFVDFAPLILKTVVSGITAITAAIVDLGILGVKAIGNLASMLTIDLLYGLKSLIPFLLNIGSWLFSFIASAALIGTVFVSISQLFGAVGSGISSMWANVKSNADAIADSTVAGMRRIGDSAQEMWIRAKAGAVDFAGVAKAVIKDIAGFFWNFGENINRIVAWFSANWNTIITDLIGEKGLIDTMFTNLAENFSRLGSFIGEVGFRIWDAFFQTLRNFTTNTFAWFSNQWSNILSDMGSFFKAFLQALMHNFKSISGDIFAALTGAGSHGGLGAEIGHLLTQIKIAFDPTLSNAEAMKRAGAAEKFMEGLRKGEGANDWVHALKGPMDFMPERKTDFSGLGKALSASGEMGEFHFGQMIKHIQEAFAGLNTPEKGLIPLLKGFKPLTPKLELLFDLPPGAITKMISDWTRKREDIKPVGEGDGLPMSTGGPGFQFKQISQARYMLGGEAAVNLDTAQLTAMQLTNKTLAEIKTIVEGILGKSKETEDEVYVPWNPMGTETESIVGW